VENIPILWKMHLLILRLFSLY